MGFLITGKPPLSLTPPITSSFDRTVPNSSHQLTSIVSIYANRLLSINLIFSFSLKVSGIFNSEILIALFFSSCVSQQALEERAALRDKVDHEECLKLSFIEGTEAYGSCRLTLKSIRAQDKNTDAIRRNGLDNRFCNRYYCW